MDQGSGNAQGAREAADAKAGTGQWVIGGLAAASFAGLLTIIGTGRADAAQAALRLFCLAIPTLLLGAFILRDGVSRYHIGCLGRCVPVIGTFTAVAGFVALVGPADAAAGWIFGVASVLCFWLVSSAELPRPKRMTPSPVPQAAEVAVRRADSASTVGAGSPPG